MVYNLRYLRNRIKRSVMENTKTREQSVDTDPMYDNREVVTDAEAEMEREQTADNMSEDDAPETDKSAETAGAFGF